MRRHVTENRAEIDSYRRMLVLAGAGAFFLPALSHAKAARDLPRLLSPAASNGRHLATAFVPSGRPVQVELPMRGHGLHPDPRHPSEALIVARRPGSVAVKVDLVEGRVLNVWQAGEDRHFFGHACYSPSGDFVYLTENDVETGMGLVSVRDASTFRVLAEYPTHGIGPHELLLMPDGSTLAVANGGVQTHPETGRVKLNRGRIETSLAYLDRNDGTLLGLYCLASRDHSLRHLAVAENGRLAAALQFEGDRQAEGSVLMVFHHGEESLRFAQAPQNAWNRMRHYGASVAWDPVSQYFALTCPMGNVIACWSAKEEFCGHIPVAGASGIAFANGRGFASNERGELFEIDMENLSASLIDRVEGVQWDNHLYADIARPEP